MNSIIETMLKIVERNEKQSHFPGKGHNETYKAVNLLVHTKDANAVVQTHVLDNGGT
jgi:hypothetical protein